MSVVAAAVPGAAAYGAGPQLCGGGGATTRKRKDAVHLVEADHLHQDQEDARRRGDHDHFLPAWQPPQQHGLFVLERVEEEEERSSIGAASDEEEEESGEEADSGGATRRRAKQHGALACMDALDDALPIKRGLSNFFSGKSRSFANLQDAAGCAQDLAKPENPFNKRRRVLRCCSIRRVASTSLTELPPFTPAAGDDDENNNKSG